MVVRQVAKGWRARRLPPNRARDRPMLGPGHPGFTACGGERRNGCDRDRDREPHTAPGALTHGSPRALAAARSPPHAQGAALGWLRAPLGGLRGVLWAELHPEDVGYRQGFSPGSPPRRVPGDPPDGPPVVHGERVRPVRRRTICPPGCRRPRQTGGSDERGAGTFPCGALGGGRAGVNPSDLATQPNTSAALRAPKVWSIHRSSIATSVQAWMRSRSASVSAKAARARRRSRISRLAWVPCSHCTRPG